MPIKNKVIVFILFVLICMEARYIFLYSYFLNGKIETVGKVEKFSIVDEKRPRDLTLYIKYYDLFKKDTVVSQIPFYYKGNLKDMPNEVKLHYSSYPDYLIYVTDSKDDITLNKILLHIAGFLLFSISILILLRNKFVTSILSKILVRRKG